MHDHPKDRLLTHFEGTLVHRRQSWPLQRGNPVHISSKYPRLIMDLHSQHCVNDSVRFHLRILRRRGHDNHSAYRRDNVSRSGVDGCTNGDVALSLVFGLAGRDADSKRSARLLRLGCVETLHRDCSCGCNRAVRSRQSIEARVVLVH